MKFTDSSHGFAAAVFYGVCSTSMAFLNKAVLSSYNFNFPFFIMACQMTVTVVFIELIMIFGKIKIPPYTLKAAAGFLLPSLAYALHATLSLMALQGLNIPMYTAVKRCTPIVNLLFSVIILRKPLPSLAITLSVVTITVGCIMAVLGDLTFDSFAYTVGGLSVLAQGLYLTLVQKSAENYLSTFEILRLNSYNTLGPFIVLSILFGEPANINRSQYLKDIQFELIFWTLVSLGAVLNYSLFLCTTLNSALTTSLVSVAKSSLQTIVGFFVFGGIDFHPLNLSGIILNFAGGLGYTYKKYQERDPKPSRSSQDGDDSKRLHLSEIGMNNNEFKA